MSKIATYRIELTQYDNGNIDYDIKKVIFDKKESVIESLLHLIFQLEVSEEV